MASSTQAIMPQVSALASCASRADTPMVPMPVRLALPALALLDDVLHQRRRRPVVARERLRHRKLLGLVHVPVFARRIERMVRIGKRHHQEERRVVLGVVEIGAGALAEERRGVKLLRDRGAIGLRHRVVVRQAVLRSEQRSSPWDRARRASGRSRRPASSPCAAHQRDMIEAVERRLHMRARLGPVVRRLLLVFRIGEMVAQRLASAPATARESPRAAAAA